MKEDRTKPDLSEHLGVWELIPAYQQLVRVCTGADSPVEIDKLFGPLAANPIRVWCAFGTAEWVVECCEGGEELDGWVEKARFSCQTGMSDEGLNED